VTPILRDIHWLSIQQRTQFKVAVLTYRCFHGLAPPYLTECLQRVLDLPSKRRLLSSSTADLVVPSTRLSAVGDSAFPVAAARTWNSLPASVTLAPSLQVFLRRIKTEQFRRADESSAWSFIRSHSLLYLYIFRLLLILCGTGIRSSFEADATINAL
jgi:hypothetical protein